MLKNKSLYVLALFFALIPILAINGMPGSWRGDYPFHLILIMLFASPLCVIAGIVVAFIAAFEAKKENKSVLVNITLFLLIALAFPFYMGIYSYNFLANQEAKLEAKHGNREIAKTNFLAEEKYYKDLAEHFRKGNYQVNLDSVHKKIIFTTEFKRFFFPESQIYNSKELTEITVEFNLRQNIDEFKIEDWHINWIINNYHKLNFTYNPSIIQAGLISELKYRDNKSAGYCKHIDFKNIKCELVFHEHIKVNDKLYGTFVKNIPN